MSLSITTQSDVERARREVRAFAISAGFTSADIESITLAAVELATNLIYYAQGGQLLVGPCRSTIGNPTRSGIQLQSTDLGPGIPDLEAALKDGFSTGGGMGGGLGGVKRLMDDVHIVSGPDGTRITARKWLTQE